MQGVRGALSSDWKRDAVIGGRRESDSLRVHRSHPLNPLSIYWNHRTVSAHDLHPRVLAGPAKHQYLIAFKKQRTCRRRLFKVEWFRWHSALLFGNWIASFNRMTIMHRLAVACLYRPLANACRMHLVQSISLALIKLLCTGVLFAALRLITFGWTSASSSKLEHLKFRF